VLPTLDNTEEEAGAPAAGHGRPPAARQGSGLLP